MTDQQAISAISAVGNRYVETPNIDRLVREGMRFENSWCTSPVCCPSRSSLVTGCMPHLTAGFPGVQTPDGPAPIFGARGFDFPPYPVKEKRLIAFGDFTDDPIAQAAAAFLREKRTRPFVLGVSLHNPHDICYWIVDQLPAEHPSAGKPDAREPSLPPLPKNFATSPDEPEFIARCRVRNYYGAEIKSTPRWDELRWRRYLHAYYRMTERADRGVGVVLDALRDAGHEDNTIVVFTSDHGEGLAAHQWVTKLMLYQEPLSVPLVFRWKGRIAAGKADRRNFASGMDVMPTVCDLAGIPLPKPVHGTSLRPVLEGRGGRLRDSAFAQLAPDMKDKAMQGRTVRTERFKYVSFSWGKNPEMLFDLKQDPGETRNLASSRRHRGELERHRALLGRWINQTGDHYRPQEKS
jgi:arylsulfatase A-like enzyme